MIMKDNRWVIVCSNAPENGPYIYGHFDSKEKAINWAKEHVLEGFNYSATSIMLLTKAEKQ